MLLVYINLVKKINSLFVGPWSTIGQIKYTISTKYFSLAKIQGFLRDLSYKEFLLLLSTMV